MSYRGSTKNVFCFHNYLSRPLVETVMYTLNCWESAMTLFFFYMQTFRLHLQIHISLLSNSSGCAHGLTFDDARRLPFVPRGNSTLVTWRERHDLEKGHDKARRRNLKRDGINCPRTETRAFLLWQNVNRSVQPYCDTIATETVRNCEDCLASLWMLFFSTSQWRKQ